MNPSRDPLKSRQRLGITELTDELNALAKACRAADPRQIDQWKHRYQEQGFAALRDLPRRRAGRPPTVTPELSTKIVELALHDPNNGCQRISRILSEQGTTLSHVTVQSILKKHQIGNRTARIQEIERRVLDGSLPLTSDRAQWIHSVNPSFCERDNDPGRPGRFWNLATQAISGFPGLGPLHIHVAVDPWNLAAFAIAGTNTRADWSVALLHNDVLPYAAGNRLPIESIRTPPSATYCGREFHHFALYLRLNDLRHETMQSPDGHTRRFLGLFRDDFIGKRRRQPFEQLEDLQRELDDWIRIYNSSHIWHGWPNMGSSPDTRLEQWELSSTSPLKQPRLLPGE